jgi:ferredoxin, 2Fe-2S
MYTLTFAYAGAENPIVRLTEIEAGQSLLEVAIDHGIPLRHECGGICSCATCHIYLMTGGDYVEFKSRREVHQLQRNEWATIYSRLACQCVLLQGQGELNIIIAEHLKR